MPKKKNWHVHFKMERIRYPNITTGYIGKKQKHGTLNSKFFSTLFNSPIKYHQPMNFPQRTPKTGFFEELASLELKFDFCNSINSLLNPTIKKIIFLSKQKALDEVSGWTLVNNLKILSRYAKFELVIELSKKAKRIKMSESIKVEALLILELSKVDLQLSKGNKVDSKPLKKIALKLIENKNIDLVTKNYALARYIVTKFRYTNAPHSDAQDKLIANCLKKGLTYQTEDSNYSIIRKSMGYRGLAMAPHFSKSENNTFLQKMERLTSLSRSKTPLEVIALKENQYTSYLTLSKWHSSLGNKKLSKSYLEKMIKIDPFDSTAFTELGLFLLKSSKPKEALKHFKKAIKLGPPAVGMNLYYIGVIHQTLDNPKSALSAFNSSTKADPLGISSWLEMIDIYSKQKKLSKVTVLANSVLNNNALKSQLLKDEIKTLIEHKKKTQ